MPHSTSWIKKAIIWRFSGVVTNEEIESATDEMYNSPEFDSLHCFIWDGSAIDKLVITERDLDIRAAMAKASSIYKRKLLGVFISDSPDVLRHINYYIQKHESFGSPWEFKITSTYKEARNYIL